MRITDGTLFANVTMQIWDGNSYSPDFAEDIIDYDVYDSNAEAYGISGTLEDVLNYLEDWKEYQDEATINAGEHEPGERVYSFEVEPFYMVYDDCGTEVFEDIISSDSEADVIAEVDHTWDRMTKTDKARRNAYELVLARQVVDEFGGLSYSILKTIKKYK